MYKKRSFTTVLWVGLAAGLAGCGAPAEDADTVDAASSAEDGGLPEGAEALSLLGEPLYPTPASAEVVAQQVGEREAALEVYDADADDADAIIWLGRRTAYLSLYRDAIEIFTEGIGKHPDDARMYRHRGHRYISVREFDRAIADLSRAAERVRGTADEVEPDGQPNARGIPTSTLQSNVHYHLGLVHYLKGDFESALESYRNYMDLVTNPDQLVAISHWRYMALRRLGRDAEAERVLTDMARVRLSAMLHRRQPEFCQMIDEVGLDPRCIAAHQFCTSFCALALRQAEEVTGRRLPSYHGATIHEVAASLDEAKRYESVDARADIESAYVDTH